jgi:hypothetical protein
MNLVSMRMSDEARKEATEPAKVEGPRYPYGLRITLDKETLEKLGIETMPDVESEVELEAVAKVVSVSANDSEYGKHRSVELQITSLGCKHEEKQDAGAALYNGNATGKY